MALLLVPSRRSATALALVWAVLMANPCRTLAQPVSSGRDPVVPSAVDEAEPSADEPTPSAQDPQAPESSLADRVAEHVPGKGALVASADWAELRITTFFYVRYLNQLATDDTYTDDFGRTQNVDRRHDVQFQKAIIYFKGFLGTEDLRYLLYVWTSNTSLGLGAQVVVAGNLTYRVADFLRLGAGIGGLPTTRSVRGQWPGWLKQDQRTIADEFFRGSFTTGVWIEGDIPLGLHYKTMLANNLSQLGVDAGQLDDGFDTLSTALWWTSDNFAALAAFGDFERHPEPAMSFGAAFTRSNETDQSQAGTESPENSQIRLSDGTGLFDPNALGDDTQITAATYRMLAVDGALKYRGFGLDGEYFVRWVNRVRGRGDLPDERFFDHGFQLQLSAMLYRQFVQAYAFHSVIFGEYGRPWDAGGGLNYFPFETRLLRVNAELIYVRNSPVGYLSYPLLVGSNGPVFTANVEVLF